MRRGELSRTTRSSGGFTLVETLVAIGVLGLVALVVLMITVSGTSGISAASVERSQDASTAQFAAAAFGRDVQGAGSIGSTPCGTASPGSTALVTLVSSLTEPVSLARKVTYWSVPGTAGVALVRSECTAAGVALTTTTVVSGLEAVPTVTCSSSCTDPSNTPRRITMRLARTTTFAFDVAGDRRSTASDPTVPSPPAVPAQLFALGGTTPPQVTGNGKLTVTGNAYVNSANASAVSMQGGNARLTVTGQFKILQGGGCSGCNATSVSSFVVGSHPGSYPTALRDPLEFLPSPTEATLTTFTCGSSTCSYQGPGVYPKQLAISGDTTFAPGSYVLRQGLAISGGTINGSGILLFNGCTADAQQPSCGNGVGSFQVSGQAAINLSPASSGTYAGILYFQSRTNTSSMSISGGSNLQLFSGVLYAPAATGVALGAGGGGLRLGAVIGKNLTVQGNGTVEVNGT